MHISDGGLSTAVCAAGYAITAAGIAFAVKGTKEEDIPKIIKIENTVKKKFLKDIIIFPSVLTYLFGLICIDSSRAYHSLL